MVYCPRSGGPILQLKAEQDVAQPEVNGTGFALMPSNMFGLRQKLMLGFGGLLAILLLVSGLGIAVLTLHRGALDKFLYENWRSVVYGQNTLDALERLNEIARGISGADHTPTSAQLATAAAASAPDLKQIDANVRAEDNNITLIPEGERLIAEKLTILWNGCTLKGEKVASDSYRVVFARLLDPNTAGRARAQAYAQVTQLSSQLKAQAQAVIKLNIDNMNPIDHRAKAMADSATRLMVLLAVVGVLLAVLYTLLASRSILRPVRAVTRSIQEIEQGNLDLVVQVRSRDELHQLAEAFNSMAAKLREFRRTDRAKLVRTQRTTQLAVNSLPDAIAIITPDGTIDLCNNTAQKLFQLAPGAALSQLRRHQLDDIFREVVASQRDSHPRGYESAIEVYDQGGELKFFLPHAVPICDSARHLLGVTLVLSDVTNLRRLDEMKSGLLSVVSHELKTPLTSIRMAVHLMLEERIGQLNPKQTELLLAAREDSDRLEKIIQDLLDMGRLESGGLALDLSSEPAERLVADAVAPLEAAFHDRGVTLDVDVLPDTPSVLVDPLRIDHVFLNVLTNALKFTHPGGRVRVWAQSDDRFVRFIVQDTGIGIPQEYLSRVFERFFRVPRDGQPSGAGLGLAIAKEIVEAHGGTITAHSGDGEGSRFDFTLKRAEPQQINHNEVPHEAGIYSHHG
jgi:signal transduction histidine kinase/HAMP domain-containing protein